MSSNFSWRCPFCNQNATITESNRSAGTHFFEKGNKDGFLGIRTRVVTCPNEQCREYCIEAFLYRANRFSGREFITGNPLATWNLRPRSQAKQFPQYVPQAIVRDYEEACLIRDLSPKASATLARRCLQGIIRDFYEVTGKGNLREEIEAIRDKVPTETWEAINVVREVGNIGAHMEQDINLIIDVEPNEAQQLIGLIELLVEETYIARQRRQEQLKGITELGQSKKAAKRPAKPASPKGSSPA